jgi:small redox-active disulfide protein 2
MEIQILGPGCRKCDDLYANVLAAVERTGLGNTATVTKVTDIDEILRLGVYTTPGLIIDDEVVSTGVLLEVEQLAEKLRARTAPPSP